MRSSIVIEFFADQLARFLLVAKYFISTLRKVFNKFGEVWKPDIMYLRD